MPGRTLFAKDIKISYSFELFALPQTVASNAEDLISLDERCRQSAPPAIFRRPPLSSSQVLHLRRTRILELNTGRLVVRGPRIVPKNLFYLAKSLFRFDFCLVCIAHCFTNSGRAFRVIQINICPSIPSGFYYSRFFGIFHVQIWPCLEHAPRK